MEFFEIKFDESFVAEGWTIPEECVKDYEDLRNYKPLELNSPPESCVVVPNGYSIKTGGVKSNKAGFQATTKNSSKKLR